MTPKPCACLSRTSRRSTGEWLNSNDAAKIFFGRSKITGPAWQARLRRYWINPRNITPYCSTEPAPTDRGKRTANLGQPAQCVKKHWSKIAGREKTRRQQLVASRAQHHERAWECEAVELLARRIAGDIASDAVLGHARAAARAHIHLAGIRALETEIINRTFLFGTLELRVRYRSTTAEIRYIKMQLKTGQPFSLPPRIDPLGPMPSEEAERMDEALRRSLPALRNLYRYERRAITERDRALSEISAILKRERNKL